MQKQSTENLVLPDAGAILTGSAHPIEKEIRRKELPGNGPERRQHFVKACLQQLPEPPAAQRIAEPRVRVLHGVGQHGDTFARPRLITVRDRAVSEGKVEVPDRTEAELAARVF